MLLPQTFMTTGQVLRNKAMQRQVKSNVSVGVCNTNTKNFLKWEHFLSLPGNLHKWNQGYTGLFLSQSFQGQWNKRQWAYREFILHFCFHKGMQSMSTSFISGQCPPSLGSNQSRPESVWECDSVRGANEVYAQRSGHIIKFFPGHSVFVWSKDVRGAVTGI